MDKLIKRIPNRNKYYLTLKDSALKFNKSISVIRYLKYKKLIEFIKIKNKILIFITSLEKYYKCNKNKRIFDNVNNLSLDFMSKKYNLNRRRLIYITTKYKIPSKIIKGMRTILKTDLNSLLAIYLKIESKKQKMKKTIIVNY